MKKILFLISALIAFTLTVNAQAWLKKLGKTAENAAKRAVEHRVEKKADETANKAMDKVEGKDSQKDKNEKSEEQTQPIQKNGKKTTVENTEGGSPKFESFSKYDFVPGDKVILYEDFSQDAVGDFPALWTTNKSGEVNTLSIASGNWLNLDATEGNWWFLKQINFPENYILEFDIVPKKGATRYAIGVHFYGENSFNEMSNPYDKATAGLVVAVSKNGWETQGLKAGQPKITGNSQLNPVEQEKVNHVIVWVQKRRVRIYHKGEKVLDMPTNLYQDSKFNRLCFELYRGASCASYVSNIKITTASPDIRNKLLTEGKLVSYGIYFDVNKADVKPESYGTLKEIAAILNEVPDVKVKIIGHTDSDGNDAANLDLSKRRAASVKNELVKNFQVSGDRLITDGAGETQPVAKNDTPTNKALNRRVEFIKM